MDRMLNLLFLEDSLPDVELCVNELKRAGYYVKFQVIQTREKFLQHISAEEFDVVLADYNLPGFPGLEALREYRIRYPDKPFLITSGSIGEETAVESIKAGANDYVLKDRLVRLPSAVEQALESWQTRLRQRQVEEALRETNEALRTLIQASPLPIFVLYPDGRVRIWNQAAEQVFGWPVGEVLDHQIPVVPEDKQEEFRSFCNRALQGESLVNVETRWQRKDDSPIDVSISIAPLRDTSGGVSNVVAVVADVTERKQAEQARRNMERKLDEAKRQFYRETILAITDGKLEIVDPPEARNAMRDAELVCELREASQLSSTRRKVQEFSAACGLKGRRLEDFVMGVGEATTNALKHAEGGKVLAGCARDTVWAAVTDTGTGIDALVLPGATLRRGFSTKPSLGLGYSVILKVSDHVKLNTGPQGTTVVMEKYLKEPPLESILTIVPDIW